MRLLHRLFATECEELPVLDDTTFKKENYLKLAEKTIGDQHDTFLYLDKKAFQILSTSSIVIAFFSALNLNVLVRPDTDVDAIILVVFSLSLVGYIVSVGTALWALLPTAFAWPIDTTWETALSALNEKTSEEYYAWLLSSIVEAYEKNTTTLAKKANKIFISTFTMGITVALVIITAIVPIVSGIITGN